MKEVIALDPWFVIAMSDLSKIYAMGGHVDRAVHEVEQALVIHPDSIDANWHYVQLLLAKLIRLAPSRPFLYYQLADVLDSLGNKQEAAEMREKSFGIGAEIDANAKLSS
ncbi:predicted protein [Nematostella vectensis]|uniref:Tetratricopeptide repeat protein n=1 Tax=Nematostella vectensis TaxID=45351 RepID=A7RYY3_NEMVE|nr:predicted protein [Nematostella vectensis]|eukprot:XP_001635331.1 predicted protein [Nematostella vectensis]